MKIENITNAGSVNSVYKFSELNDNNPNESTTFVAYIGDDITNCKLSYIHGIGSLYNVRSDNEKKEITDYLLKRCKGCVIINTTQKTIADFIRNTYPTYYYQELPLGYGTANHYHVCIQNTVFPNANCKAPTPAKEKTEIKDKLIAFLKSKRRKTDFVDEFISLI